MKVLRWLDIAFYLACFVWVAANPQRSVRYWSALAVAAVAFGFWIAARVQLGNAFSVGAKAKYLVTTGLYSKLRNPVYFFGHIAITFTAIAWGNWILAICILVLGIPWQVLRAHRESQVLEAAFGDEYRQYRAQTWF